MRGLLLAVWAAGAALCVALAVGATHIFWMPTTRAWMFYGASFATITIGVVVWGRRPDSRTGALLTAFAFAALLNELNVVFPESALAVTIGAASIQLAAPILVHLVLSYPSGRLESRLDRAFVGVAYAFAFAYALPYLLFNEPRAPFDPEVWVCPACAAPLTHIAWYDVSGITDVLDGIFLVLALLFLALLVRKLVRATPRGRSVVLPLVVMACFVAGQFAVQLVLFGEPVNSWTHTGWFWVVWSAVLLVPLSLAAGLLWGRTGRSAVADLVVELQGTPPGSVRDALAATLGDPSLELALWLPERGTYVDGTGQPRELPPPGSRRAVTVLGPAEAPLAALVHDPALLERRGLLEATAAAARLALENERLQAELRAQLVELRASRARIVQAGDDERRRLERDLHDGAQQRLLSLGLALQLARSELGPESNGASELLSEAEGELRSALDELRELARGIHPAILTNQGLGAALRSLAERSAVPVTILAVPQDRLGEPIEAAAYFVVSESLANVAKYAHASQIRVSITHRNGDAIVDIEDDGVGGADPDRGSGLRGLSDRVHALDGTLLVESPAGGGTRIHAEIPCAS